MGYWEAVAMVPEAMRAWKCIHREDSPNAKCYEACARDNNFKVKGLTNPGACPSSYSHLDSSKAVVEFNPNAECTKDADCPSSYCQNGFCHGCFDKCCETDNDCKKKGMGYCQNDQTKMPPYFCHA